MSDMSALPEYEASFESERQSEIRAVLTPPPGSPPLPSMRTLEGPQFIDAVVETQPSDWKQELARTSDFRVIVVLDGRLEMRDEVATLTLAGGDAIIHRNDFIIEESVAGEGELERVVVTFAWPALTPDEPCVIQDSAGRLRELARWVLVERHADFDGATRYRADLLKLLVDECQRLAVDSAGALERQLRAYVLEHIEESITLDAIAKQVGIGRHHLCRKYRKITGQSPMWAVRAIRMEQARDLIRGTGLPLRTIAKRVGLRSEQHLSRLLRTHFGVGVRELRSGTPLSQRPE